MKEAEFDVAIGFIIRTEQPIETISSIMGTSPSMCFDQSELDWKNTTERFGSIWTLRKRYKKQTDIGECIQDYISQIPECITKIADIKKFGTCELRISVVSIWGQIFFSLSEDDLMLLNRLNIPFQISVFSYGNCVDDTN